MLTETISFAASVSVPADVLRQELEGESVLLSLDGGCYYGLDEVGNSMWNALTSTDSIEAAYSRLAEQYLVEESRLRGDLLDLVRKLSEHGLLNVHEN